MTTSTLPTMKKTFVVFAMLLGALAARAQFSKATVLMEGVVLDENALKPIGATIEVLDATTRERVNSYHSNKASGAYQIVMKPSQHFIFHIAADGFFTTEEEVRMPAATKYEHITRDFSLKPNLLHSEIPLAGQLFDYKKKDLKVGAEEDLEDVARLLKLNPTARISITAYPDMHGPAERNIALTQARANAVREYLVTQGIDPLRLQTSGEGDVDPAWRAPQKREAKGKHPVGKVYLRVEG